ncbi:MAG: hypothetical protein JWO19_1916 [Bryobacterales bacterium]|jgi:hypothetical protein|nr:hypothetical protein [Bryobacterales bacterium]
MAARTQKKRKEPAKKAIAPPWGGAKRQEESLKVHGDKLDTPKKPARKKGK